MLQTSFFKFTVKSIVCHSYCHTAIVIFTDHSISLIDRHCPIFNYVSCYWQTWSDLTGSQGNKDQRTIFARFNGRKCQRLCPYMWARCIVRNRWEGPETWSLTLDWIIFRERQAQADTATETSSVGSWPICLSWHGSDTGNVQPTARFAEEGEGP